LGSNSSSSISLNGKITKDDITLFTQDTAKTLSLSIGIFFVNQILSNFILFL
jgi:hypothetical protein